MRREVKTERMVRDEMVLIVSPNHAWARVGVIAPGSWRGCRCWCGNGVGGRGGWWSGR